MHYARTRKYGTAGPAETLLESNVGRTCAVDACGQQAKCKGLCAQHMGRFVSRGITYDDYKVLLDRQDGRCAICGRPESELTIDHDHDHCHNSNGCRDCIRGLLCGTCNTGLGKFGDDPAILLRALSYLVERS
jgi:hypothetical protein